MHFIRCIKPNENKEAGRADSNYVLTQVRYLGVFETVAIRKSSFPSRWTYEEFVGRFGVLFPDKSNKGKTNRDVAENIVKGLGGDSKGYLFGTKRVYMCTELENKLMKKFFEVMKKKI